MYKYIFIFLNIICLNIFAQSIEKERFDFLVDSLSAKKSSLLLEKETLTADIGNLHNLLAEYEERCKSARSDQLVKKYGKTVGKRIVQGQVWKGMSEKMLEDSWGKPDKITKNKEKWGTFTQWYYGDITYFFRDGTMTDWEETN